MSGEVSCFEDFELDPNAYRLSHSGQVIRLERIPLELLCLLVERRGELVTRDAILERIWGKGIFIDSENAINTAIRKLRRALHDGLQRARVSSSLSQVKDTVSSPPFLIGNGEPTSNEKSEQQVNGKSANYTLTAATLDETQPHLPGFWSAKSLAVAGLALIAGITIALWHLLPHTTQL